MKIAIQINADNSAFEGDEIGPSAGRILNRLAARLATMGRDHIRHDVIPLRDINGNPVGTCKVVED